MNKFTKIIFATSAAIFMVISTNSYSFTGGDGIGGRARDVERAKYEEQRMEARQKEPVTSEAKPIPIKPHGVGEGIGGRAWIVDLENHRDY